MIQLDDETLQKAISAAILENISGEARDQLFKGAIAHLLETEIEVADGPYRAKRKVSKIVYAFENAVQQVATIQARELFESEPYVTKLDEILRDVLDKVLEVKREKIVEELSDQIVSAIAKGFAREY